MKHCDECNKNRYEEQMQAQQDSMPKFSANSNSIQRSVNCSICEKEIACTDRDFQIVFHLKNRDSEPQTIRFKNVGSKCNDYLSMATANDVYELHSKLSERLNPLNKEIENEGVGMKKKSLFKRIFK